MNDFTKINNLLAMLGTTIDQITERLVAEGCFGRSGCDDCPVAIYLRKHGLDQASVGVRDAAYWDHDKTWRNWTPLPYVITIFVRMFDSGRIPILSKQS